MVPRTASSKMAEEDVRGKRAEFQLICEGHRTKMRSNSFQKLHARIRGGEYASDTKTDDAWADCCRGSMRGDERAAHREIRAHCSGMRRRLRDPGDYCGDRYGAKADVV